MFEIREQGESFAQAVMMSSLSCSLVGRTMCHSAIPYDVLLILADDIRESRGALVKKIVFRLYQKKELLSNSTPKCPHRAEISDCDALNVAWLGEIFALSDSKSDGIRAYSSMTLIQKIKNIRTSYICASAAVPGYSGRYQAQSDLGIHRGCAIGSKLVGKVEGIINEVKGLDLPPLG